MTSNMQNNPSPLGDWDKPKVDEPNHLESDLKKFRDTDLDPGAVLDDELRLDEYLKDIKVELAKAIDASVVYCLFDPNSDAQYVKIDNEVDLAIELKIISENDAEEMTSQVMLRAEFEMWAVDQLAMIVLRSHLIYDIDDDARRAEISEDGGRLLALLGMFGYGQDWQNIVRDSVKIPLYSEPKDQHFLDDAYEKSDDLADKSPASRLAWSLLRELKVNEIMKGHIPEKWLHDMTSFCYTMVQYALAQPDHTPIENIRENLMNTIEREAESRGIGQPVQSEIFTIMVSSIREKRKNSSDSSYN